MLNMKKGLAVALAAATVLTFAPVSAFAGTLTTLKSGAITTNSDGKVTSDNTVNLKTTMNENANIWSYEEVLGKDAHSTQILTDEQGAYVVLTPSNPEGSVTFTQNVIGGDALKDGQWYYNDSTNSNILTAQPVATNKESGSTLQLTAGKNSKTLKIKASVSFMRALGSKPVDITVAQTGTADDKTLVEPSLNTGLSLHVILVNHDVKMNNLKVTLSTAGDSAHDRYLNHDQDVYDFIESRPTGLTANGNDIATTDDKDIATPDGKRIDAVEPIVLNLADASKDQPLKVESTAGVTYKSDDNNIATIDKDGIHAKAVGDTTVYITTTQTGTSYGEITDSINVKVVNKPSATLNVPSDLTVTGYGVANETLIGATGTNIQKNSIKYDFVYWEPITQKYVSFRDLPANNHYADLYKINPFELDTTKDAVFVNAYPGNDDSRYNWNAYLEVKATGATGYNDPATKYVKLHFNKDAAFTLDSESQSLHTGESVQITTKSASAVTGAAFTYKSYNPAVATVSNTGVITAVGEGSTTVDVTYAGLTKSIAVTVTNYENGQGSTAAPEKVTGVTVSNKKGAKVSVNWTSQASNVNYRVYKKVGSGKWVAKNVTSNKATLSVKKGAKVTVKVKAFVKGTDGKTVWGPKATQAKAFKTDKK